MLGTPEYLSPEQARGDKVKAQSDLYSLGVVVYNMLAKKPVFYEQRSASYDAVINAHAYERPVDLSIKGYPMFSAIIMNLLEKYIKNRVSLSWEGGEISLNSSLDVAKAITEAMIKEAGVKRGSYPYRHVV